jgi:hypothetical protein
MKILFLLEGEGLSFDGHELSPTMQKPMLERFKGAADEGFREVK